MPFCPNCGKDISEEFNVCPHCGKVLKATVASQVTIGTKNPGVGAILSLLLAGLGQMYAGRIGRGLLILFLLIPFNIVVTSLFFRLVFPLFLPLALWIWNMYDAYNLCKKYNALLIQTGKPPW